LRERWQQDFAPFKVKRRKANSVRDMSDDESWEIRRKDRKRKRKKRAKLKLKKESEKEKEKESVHERMINEGPDNNDNFEPVVPMVKKVKIRGGK
jgi:hypothetical protein